MSKGAGCSGEAEAMNEAEWDACDDPDRMLKLVRDRPSERKLRLFACACCRRVWHLLHPNSRRAVEVMERYVDGQVGEGERDAAEGYAGVLVRNCNDRVPAEVRIEGAAAHGVFAALGAVLGDEALGRRGRRTDPRKLARAGASYAAEHAREALAREAGAGRSRVRSEAARAQCALLRDLFGNPFRPVTFDPLWRTAAVDALARGVYEERAFDRLPFLADALEEAGCPSEEILSHCRGPGPHVRGCWVIDLIGGRE
jgi:hypothetical protein